MDYFDVLKNWEKFRKFIDTPLFENYMKMYCSRCKIEYKKNTPLIELNTKVIEKYKQEYEEFDERSDYVRKHLDQEPYKFCLPHDCPQSNGYLLPGFLYQTI